MNKKNRDNQIARITIRDGARCKWCGGESYLTRDHVIARSLGGSDDDTNLQILCYWCNQTKYAMLERRNLDHSRSCEEGSSRLLNKSSWDRAVDDGWCPAMVTDQVRPETRSWYREQKKPNGKTAHELTKIAREYVEARYRGRAVITEPASGNGSAMGSSSSGGGVMVRRKK